MIVPLRPLLDAAREHKFAYGAFNVNSPLHAKAAIEMLIISCAQNLMKILDFQ